MDDGLAFRARRGDAVLTDFTVGPRVAWCGGCGFFLDGDPDHCSNCHARFDQPTEAVVTKVDRARGVVTVSSPAPPKRRRR
jgi:hypothetical protein